MALVRKKFPTPGLEHSEHRLLAYLLCLYRCKQHFLTQFFLLEGTEYVQICLRKNTVSDCLKDLQTV